MGPLGLIIICWEAMKVNGVSCDYVFLFMKHSLCFTNNSDIMYFQKYKVISK